MSWEGPDPRRDEDTLRRLNHDADGSEKQEADAAVTPRESSGNLGESAEVGGASTLCEICALAFHTRDYYATTGCSCRKFGCGCRVKREQAREAA